MGDCSLERRGKPMTTEELLKSDKKFRYMMLDRLRLDCLYYLGNGNRKKKYLWANEETEHVEIMEALYDSFSDEEKPEWISMDNIKEFKRKMCDNTCCCKAIPCCGCNEYETCSKAKLSPKEIDRYLRHHTDATIKTTDVKEIEWWVKQYPVFSYIPKRNASEFMEKMNHVLCRAGMDMLGYIQNYNYYKKFWGEQETCKRFVNEAIKAAEFLDINIGISQNDNEAIVILKCFA